ncbi:MAG TPA: hypothetical protein VFN37_14470 [Candidatus Baltobacteraceae bacterium]|nr:hypothetical protein [Candidatus Baltobacteraceae bacterium]
MSAVMTCVTLLVLVGGAGVAVAVGAGVAVTPGAGVDIGAGVCPPPGAITGSGPPPPEEEPLPPPHAASTGRASNNAMREVLKHFITLWMIGLKRNGLKLPAGQAKEHRG